MSESGDLSVRFLSQGEQRAEDVAQEVAGFIREAKRSLDLALYDFRLSPDLQRIVVDALQERADSGVSIRIAYDAGKLDDPDQLLGVDPAPVGTADFVESLGFPARAVGGPKLMHQKYMLRDAGDESATVWTGSLNFTDDAFTLQDNNVVVLRSSELALEYEQDFAQLWRKEIIDHSGNFPTSPATLHYGGQPAPVQVMFSPGKGEEIDHEVAHLIRGAQRRVVICSMLLTSRKLLDALNTVLEEGRVPVWGVYDRTQMEQVVQDWSDDPQGPEKIDAYRRVVQSARLAGKNSTPYSPDTPHDFMHNKILVIDDTVVTGSYNLSRSATLNAENILLIENVPLAERYLGYIEHLMKKYGSE